MSYVDYPYENQLLCEENKQLRAEINEQARLLGISAEKELALRAENERLKAELAEAKKDIARLDWLEKQNADIDKSDAWCVTTVDFTDEDAPHRYWVGADLRGAIDAVMKGK